MNAMTEGQYERLARWLDGEDVPLTEAERIAAESIRRQESALGAHLPTPVPPRAFARAEKRLTAALAGQGARLRWRHYAVRAAASLAVAMLVASVILRPELPDRTVNSIARGLPGRVSLDAWLKTVQESATVDEIDLLGTEVNALRAEVVTSQPPSVSDLKLDAIQKEIEELWLEGIPEDLLL